MQHVKDTLGVDDVLLVLEGKKPELVERLQGVAKRSARFRCVVALVTSHFEGVVEGRCEGQILHAPRGVHGFGYDPLFEPSEHPGRSMAELTMAEKIAYFANATHVVGAIGGGMCNLVFAKPSCRVACIASPEFERINNRFLYTMSHTTLTMYRDTESTSLLYRRVRLPTGEIGELVAEDKVCLGNGVTWTAGQGQTVSVDPSTLTFLDAGLNSPWSFDVEAFLQTIE
jgi:hypothetical protein